MLTPNLKGFEAAVLDKPDEIVVFGSASGLQPAQHQLQHCREH